MAFNCELVHKKGFVIYLFLMNDVLAIIMVFSDLRSSFYDIIFTPRKSGSVL